MVATALGLLGFTLVAGCGSGTTGSIPTSGLQRLPTGPVSTTSGSASASSASRGRTCAEYRREKQELTQGLYALIKALNGNETEDREAWAALATADGKMQAIVLRLQGEVPADREALAKAAEGLAESQKAGEKAAAGNDAEAEHALTEIERTSKDKSVDIANKLCGVPTQ